MIDIFRNNLKEFNIHNSSCNTIICDAFEIEMSPIFELLSPIEKRNIHLNVNVYSDKDIESFIYLEQNGCFKSINIILNSCFNLSTTACKKLEQLVNINSVFNHTEDDKIKGGSFKNYILTTATLDTNITNTLLSTEALFSIKNFSKKENNEIIFDSINKISKEILDFFKSKDYSTLDININENIIKFDIDILYIIINRISNYTYNININIENNLKFNIVYRKTLEDMKNDYKSHNNLSDCAYNLIIYQTLLNLDISSKLFLCNFRKNNSERYYIQVKLSKYWFNLDIIYNYEFMVNENILTNDKEFEEFHTITEHNCERCTISYKRFYKKYNFFKLIKNKLNILFFKSKKSTLTLPAPRNKNLEINKDKSIFENI